MDVLDRVPGRVVPTKRSSIGSKTIVKRREAFEASKKRSALRPGFDNVVVSMCDKYVTVAVNRQMTPRREILRTSANGGVQSN